MINVKAAESLMVFHCEDCEKKFGIPVEYVVDDESKNWRRLSYWLQIHVECDPDPLLKLDGEEWMEALQKKHSKTKEKREPNRYSLDRGEPQQVRLGV